VKYSLYVCGMENNKQHNTVYTFNIQKNQWGFYTTTIYENGKVVGYVDTNNKTEAVKTTSSQKKLREHAELCKIFS